MRGDYAFERFHGEPPLSVIRSRSLDLSGWGRFPVEKCDAYRPESVEEIRELIRVAPSESLISRGMGRSYGDASLNSGRGVILHERLNRILSFDPETGLLHCEASVTLAEIIDVFLPQGFFPAVTPGSKNISLGGAIAADVHGKNHHRDGTISGQVLGFHVLTGEGELVSCSRSENSRLFWATLGGMGLTGAVVDVRLKLRRVDSSYLKTQTIRTTDLQETLDEIILRDRDYDYSVAWIDCLARKKSLGRALLLRANPASPSELPSFERESPYSIRRKLPLTVPFSMPSFFLNSGNMKAFNSCFYWWPRRTEALRDFESYFYPLDAISNWNRVYGQKGVLQYQLVLPLESSSQGLREILERVAESGWASFLGVLKSTGPESGGLLSFPFEGTSLALDFPNRHDSIFAFLRELDRLVIHYGGRTYLAKDSSLTPSTFRTMYPAYEDFLEVKAEVDPNGRFSSSLSRRIGLTE